MTGPLHLLVPGPLRQRTGGYLYDARIVDELRRAGRPVEVHEVPGRFPEADATARSALDRALASIPDGAPAVVDGLALGGLPEVAAAHGPRLGLVALVHHPLSDETGLPAEAEHRLHRSERAALAAASGVIVTSAFTRRRLADFGVPAARVRAVEPGSDPAPPARGPEEGRGARLLCVGTVTPRKGHDLLVDALASLGDRAWDCVCVGSLDRDPGFASGVRAAAERAGLGDRVVFTGELGPAELSGEWDRASIFVLPSWYEGYGMALSEALVRGLPVVSTTGGAIPFTVPAEAGILVPPGDRAALARGLATLLDDDGERAARAGAARRHAAGLPTWSSQALRFAEAVEELLDV